MRDKAESGTSWLQYDKEGNVVARIQKSQEGAWMIVPQPDYPFVVMIDTGQVLLWDRKRNCKVEFAGDTPGKLEQDHIL